MISDPAFWGLLFALCALGNVLLACCCVGCTICSDDFDRDNDTDIDTGSPCGWTEVSGTWAINSNYLLSGTSASAGLVLCDTAHPDGEATLTVEVDFYSDTSGISGFGLPVMVIVGYVDSNTYFRALYNSDSVAIQKISGGTPTPLVTADATIDNDEWYTAKVCVNESGQITLYLDGVALCQASTYETGGVTGDQCGLGNGGFALTRFDNFSLAKAYNSDGATSCPQCQDVNWPCEDACENDEAPREWLVVIADMDGQFVCDDGASPVLVNCQTTDGFGDTCGNGTGDCTYLLGPNQSLSCAWIQSNIGSFCGFPGSPPYSGCGLSITTSYITVSLSFYGPSPGGFASAVFRKTISGSTPYDCLGIDGLDIPFLSNVGCDWSAATCTLYALS